MPYVKSSQIFDCPSQGLANQKFVYAGPNGGVPALGVTGRGSYSLNCMYRNSGTGTDLATGACSNYESGYGYSTKMSQVQASATTIWISENDVGLPLTAGGVHEGNVYSWWLFSQNYDNIHLDAGTTPSNVTAFNGSEWGVRHLGTLNALYIDGHVKAIRTDDIMKTNGKTPNVNPQLTIEDD